MISHRRSTTVQHMPMQSITQAHRGGESWRSMHSSSQQQDARSSEPAWRHRRAQSHHDQRSATQDWASAVQKANERPASLPAPPTGVTTGSLNWHQRANKRHEKPVSKQANRADQVDNWRVKTSSLVPSVSTTRPPSRSSSSKHASTDSSLRLRESNDQSSSVTPEVLPPLRVTMEPTPIEVLPPLRFSMDPAINGRSAWRFVLPSPKQPEYKAEEVQTSAEMLFDDLPRWFTGNESDIIVRLGNRDRPVSPSADSTASSSSSSFSASSRSAAIAPPLDSSDSASSTASSQTASPELGFLQLDYGYEEEDSCNVKTPLAMQNFVVPSLSAAAPLPSHLPMPSFLVRK